MVIVVEVCENILYRVNTHIHCISCGFYSRFVKKIYLLLTGSHTCTIMYILIPSTHRKCL